MWNSGFRSYPHPTPVPDLHYLLVLFSPSNSSFLSRLTHWAQLMLSACADRKAISSSVGNLEKATPLRKGTPPPPAANTINVSQLGVGLMSLPYACWDMDWLNLAASSQLYTQGRGHNILCYLVSCFCFYTWVYVSKSTSGNLSLFFLFVWKENWEDIKNPQGSRPPMVKCHCLLR